MNRNVMQGRSQQNEPLQPFRDHLQQKAWERVKRMLDHAVDNDHRDELERRLLLESNKMRKREREYRSKLENKILEFDRRERECEERLEKKIMELEMKLCVLENRLRINFQVNDKSTDSSTAKIKFEKANVEENLKKGKKDKTKLKQNLARKTDEENEWQDAEGDGDVYI